MNVLVYDPYVSEKVINDFKCRKVDILDGLKKADFISIHTPLNINTKNLIAKNEFLKMKKNCVLINTSRGGIINQEDLVWALDNQIISGAGLDVYTEEPIKKLDPIIKTKNTILTPHNSALTLECRIKMGMETIKNINQYLEGNPILSNIINKEILS